MRFIFLPYCLASVILRFVFAVSPSNYSAWRRLTLVLRITWAYINLRRQSASSVFEQLILVDAILKIDPKIEGDIAEFGCFKGASSAVLSIAANFVGRKLLIFDSFEGLPEVREEVRNIHSQNVINYRKGMYAGSLEVVKGNIARFGHLSCVEFIQGFYQKTLPIRPVREKYAFIFEDADLESSVKDVLRHAWPRLSEGCSFFCHEARDLEVCSIFFNDAFWAANFGSKAPGLVGAGMGLPIIPGGFDDPRIEVFFGRFGSYLAYTCKR